ncbi:MAG: hypothetical protein WDO69_29745 [Pseudomonadota bacterium]
MKKLVWLGLVLLTGCGGSVTSTLNEPEGAGGLDSAGSSNGGGGGGKPHAGESGVAGTSTAGDSGVAGVSNGGASAGTGGKVPDFPGGAAGEGPLSCSALYAGPSGGPRANGPADLGDCTAIPDEVVLARYKDYAARVPQGLYYEPNESITFWHEPCSKSAEETVARGATDGMGTFVESYESEWFYEAVYCFNDSVRRIERSLRCDYFDGSKLANPTPERVAFLASMLWWASNNNVGGSAILGHSVAIGDATDVVGLCTISVTYGDFGLCDEVRLESTKHLLRANGGVELGSPQVIRTLEGDCH